MSTILIYILSLSCRPFLVLSVLVSLPQTHTCIHSLTHNLLCDPYSLTISLTTHRYVTTLVETIQYYSGHFHQQEEQLARHVQSWALQCDERIKHSLDKLHTVKKAVAQRQSGTIVGGEVSAVSCRTCSIATVLHLLSWTLYMPYPFIHSLSMIIHTWHSSAR
jgi:hypothetical protein